MSRGSLPAIAIAAAARMPGKAGACQHTNQGQVLPRESRAAHERRDIAHPR
jgi:hypothetical protein